MDIINKSFNKIISILLFTVLVIMLTIGGLFFFPPSYGADVAFVDLTYVSSGSTHSYDNGVLTVTDSGGSVFSFDASGLSSGDIITISGTVPVLSNNSSYSSFDFRYNGVSFANIYPLPSAGNSFTLSGEFEYDGTNNTILLYSNSHRFSLDLSTVTLSSDGFGNVIDPTPATIIVRPGNVAYIGYNEGYCNLSVRLNSAVKSYSSNVRIGFSASRPAEGSTLYYDNSTGNSVSWTNSQPRDILGRSTYFIYHETFNTVGYFIIYNPAYDDAGNINNAISAEFSAYTSVVQFPLTSSLVDGSVVSTGDADEYYMSQGVDMMSTPGVPTYIYTGTDGTTSSAIEVPASQYNYYAPEENEEGLISGFVDRIVKLLSAPVKHIQNLFNEGLTFMTWLSGLWSWLPVEVVGILTSALIVLIVVGVIKVFWK